MAKTQEELRTELIALLRSHDWYYDRADDWRAYSAGRSTYYRILDLVKQLPDGEALYAARGKVEV